MTRRAVANEGPRSGPAISLDPPEPRAKAPPAHPGCFIASALVEALDMGLARRLGPHRWEIEEQDIVARWDDSGGWLAVTAEGEASWFLVDPLGGGLPEHGGGAVGVQHAAVAELTARWARPTGPLTAERFWDLVASAPDLRLEYLDGRLFAMAGAGLRHEAIGPAVSHALWPLRRRGCAIYGANLYLDVSRNGRYLLPDVTVVCGREDLVREKGRPPRLRNPTLLVEVLSPSTRRYDLGGKKDIYLSIPSLKQYLVVDTRERRVHLWTRHGEDFEHVEVTSGVLEILGEPVDMADFYVQVEAQLPP